MRLEGGSVSGVEDLSSARRDSHDQDRAPGMPGNRFGDTPQGESFTPFPPSPRSALLVFEEFDFAEALLGPFERFVWPAEILALARDHLIAPLHFHDHVRPPSPIQLDDLLFDTLEARPERQPPSSPESAVLRSVPRHSLRFFFLRQHLESEGLQLVLVDRVPLHHWFVKSPCTIGQLSEMAPG